jgi:hypothetical protein
VDRAVTVRYAFRRANKTDYGFLWMLHVCLGVIDYFPDCRSVMSRTSQEEVDLISEAETGNRRAHDSWI